MQQPTRLLRVAVLDRVRQQRAARLSSPAPLYVLTSILRLAIEWHFLRLASFRPLRIVYELNPFPPTFSLTGTCSLFRDSSNGHPPRTVFSTLSAGFRNKCSWAFPLSWHSIFVACLVFL